ncbi:3-hydroxyacyl-CoA dehydrogenase/enoyl-CoA hydratase family protein [Kyrpidia sp.]|uniref:3-hydroxyacyl-CoA dehydrogenase/enoyl-CoA hydratase family protein n=1 Tax=Kyrpidia sp. TaxID=2073077 RepID=UPI002584A5D4|nr:3-hydroxyacyl-CoA dehydrogenase/enoyl-CoA hydratase family protein [Kyrpidia sp.]MCL6576295.1 3-hydroxyacyl-CoA dehydrogenase/enoyl-CoA hydratase family protein [Kyrpidia sp.]
MTTTINRVAVLGSGVMGAAIAAHLAGVGLEVELLDMVPSSLTEAEKAKGLTLSDPEVRLRIVRTGLERALKARPAAFYTQRAADRIRIGNFEDHLDRIADCQWIIEVIVENLEAKRALLKHVEAYRRPGTVVSSNTSGVSITKMAEGRSEEFQAHFLGTHFFNPPRYMKLLEIIPTAKTRPDVVEDMCQFATRVLGKGVVVAKDTPNFIANRIGTYGLLATVQAMLEDGYTVEDVDAVFGPAMGRPKSAVFRTLDLVGIDTFVHVAHNVRDSVSTPEEKAAFEVPPFILEMVKRGWIGEKAGQGIYKRVKSEAGREILTLDPSTMEYRPRKKAEYPSLTQAKYATSLGDKIRALLFGKDRASALAWKVTKKTLLYTASKIPEIADDILAVDRAMKWGFNWELGPFELWDLIGVREAVERMRVEGEAIPPLVEDLLAQGLDSWYHKEPGRVGRFMPDKEVRYTEEPKEWIHLPRLREEGKVVMENSGAALYDLGDGVACLEFRSPHNAIGPDVVEMMFKAAEEVSKNWRGLVIGNQAKNFSVGANLFLILMGVQEEEWDEVEMAVNQFQQANMRLKYLDKPVVAAPFAMTLGGGAEVCFAASRVQASAETYMGLVETGVGVIPGGGGTKELLLRAIEGVPEKSGVDLQPLVNRTFETIAMAKVSTSAAEAKEMGFLRAGDGISVNPDTLLYDAKRKVLQLAENGYRPPVRRKIPVVGEPGYAVMAVGAYTLRMGGYISEHDEKIAKKLAWVLAGGSVPAGTLVSEQYLLDLEREAFLSLAGEPKTQERMAYMLKHNKPLRN